MTNYIMVGGGDHAISIINLNFNKSLKNKILGYCDNHKTHINLKYLGKDDDIIKKYKNYKNLKFIIAIGINIKIREKIFNKFKKLNLTFETLIEKTAQISSSANIGEGSIIFKNSIIGPDCKIGKNVVIHSSCVIEHHSSIGDNSYCGPGSIVCGRSIIKKNCLLGAKVCVIEKKIIEKNNTIGAGSVIVKNIDIPNQTYFGVPAKQHDK